jgi:hypothetical protein
VLSWAINPSVRPLARKPRLESRVASVK